MAVVSVMPVFFLAAIMAVSHGALLTDQRNCVLKAVQNCTDLCQGDMNLPADLKQQVLACHGTMVGGMTGVVDTYVTCMNGKKFTMCEKFPNLPIGLAPQMPGPPPAGAMPPGPWDQLIAGANCLKQCMEDQRVECEKGCEEPSADLLAGRKDCAMQIFQSGNVQKFVEGMKGCVRNALHSIPFPPPPPL